MSDKTYRPNNQAPMPTSPPANKTEVDQLRQQIADLIGQKPEKAAIVLTEWLNYADKTAKSPRKKAG